MYFILKTQNINKILEIFNKMGYEVKSGEVVNLVEKGIIDPVKVVRLALENAIGVGTSILTTDCLIGIDQSEDDNKSRKR